MLLTEAGINFETAIVATLALIILATGWMPAPYLLMVGAGVGILRWALIGA